MMIYSFENSDGSFDFLKITEELHTLLKKNNNERVFLDAYEDEHLKGIRDFLLVIGLEPESIIENVSCITDIPFEASVKIMKQLQEQLSTEPFHDEPQLLN